MITPSRLRLARKRRGLTIVKLARQVGVSTRSLSGYENGTQQPTAEVMRLLATSLRIPPGFLQAEDIDEVPVAAVSFRALSKMTASQRDAALSAGRLAMLLEQWITARFKLPEPDLPSLPDRDPEMAAGIVRARWGLGEAPIRNVIHLLESRGVRVFSLPLECAATDAFSLFRREATPFVFLNTAKTAERIRFDGCHELGHLVLHPQYKAPYGPEAELAANRFAAEVLMPRASVVGYPLRNATVDRILEARRIWKVSAMALTHRLRELELLSEWGYWNACRHLSSMGYRRSEPGGIQQESSQVLTKVFRAIREDGLHVGDIANDLQMSSEDLTASVLGLAPIALEGGNHSGPRVNPSLKLVQGAGSID
jgi:Zn-dependent peptidase ImmA (M78 family)/DNA-binding XRE family transcriptional regulator